MTDRVAVVWSRMKRREDAARAEAGRVALGKRG